MNMPNKTMCKHIVKEKGNLDGVQCWSIVHIISSQSNGNKTAGIGSAAHSVGILQLCVRIGRLQWNASIGTHPICHEIRVAAVAAGAVLVVAGDDILLGEGQELAVLEVISRFQYPNSRKGVATAALALGLDWVQERPWKPPCIVGVGRLKGPVYVVPGVSPVVNRGGGRKVERGCSGSADWRLAGRNRGYSDGDSAGRS